MLLCNLNNPMSNLEKSSEHEKQTRESGEHEKQTQKSGGHVKPDSQEKVP